MKSDRHAALMALRWAVVGAALGAAVAGAAAAGWGAGVIGAADEDLPPFSAPIAFWQAGERLSLCFWRHCRAGIPPGVTPEQFAMKSPRHADLMALRWAVVGCWAKAAPAPTVTAQSTDTIAKNARRARRGAAF